MMTRSLARIATFEHFALALTGLSVIALYALALSFRPVAAYPMVPPFTVIEPEPAGEAQPPARHTAVVRVRTTDGLSAVFDRIGYRLESVHRHGEVPRLFLASLPEDITTIEIPRDRKILFIKAALPLILQVNEQILADRRRLETIRDDLDIGLFPGPVDMAWFEKMVDDYALETPDLDELLRRVDIIPPSLALAQSAEESGWGTSRFARKGNALFGQRTFKGRHGLVPLQRDSDKRHRVRAFAHLLDGVRAYADNLNIHPAYAPFREARARARREGERAGGMMLAGTLAMYSERREDYVKSIRAIIRANALWRYDGARLGDGLAVIADVPDA